MPIQAKVGWRAYVSPVTASYLLDSYSGAAAAYSLRKLRTTYSGPAIRVRRSSDNTEQNIGFDASGNLDTTALLSFVGAGNGFVTIWYDQSGNNLHFAQSTAANQPSIVINSAVVLTLGEPAVRFNSTNKNYLEIPSSTSSFNFLHNGTDSTVISVGRYNFVTNPGTDSTLISNGGNGSATVGTWVGFSDVSPLNNCFGVSISRGVGGIGDGATHTAQSMVSDTALPYTKQNLHFVNINAGAAAIDRIKVQYDNNTIAKSNIRSNTPSTANATNNMMMGVYIQGGVKYSSLEGDVQELIIYNSNQDTNRTGITSNINAHYSIYSNVSSLLTSLYAVYNADATGSSSLKTSLFAAYNGESNTNDSFGSNNGTAVGGLTYTTGKIGNAFQFNGTNAYVSIPNNSLNFTGDFSYSAWVKTNTSGNYVVLGNYTYTGGLNYGYAISLRGNDLYFQITNGATIVSLIYTNSSGWSSQYNHITITRKNSTGSEIYVNGTKVISNTSSVNPLYTSTHYSTIGIAQDPAFYWRFNGQIDALNIWSKALTQSEITELYNSGNGAQYIGDNFYKPTVNDALNTYNGTAQGGLTYEVGKVGTAFKFNGTNANILVSNGAWNFTGNFSISMWVKFSSSGLSQILISNFTIGGATTVSGWFVEKTSTELRFRGYNNGNLVLNATKTAFSPSTSVYTHLVVSKGSVNSKIYIDGVLDTTSTATGAPNYESTNYPMIGANKYNSTTYQEFFNGNIDALNIWNKELSASEITELYNSGNGKQYPY